MKIYNIGKQGVCLIKQGVQGIEGPNKIEKIGGIKIGEQGEIEKQGVCNKIEKNSGICRV